MINLFYNVDRPKTIDRNKSYYSVHYDYAIVLLDTKYAAYNIATRYNEDTKKLELFLVLYNNKTKDNILLKKHCNGGYKIYFKDYLPKTKQDYNIDISFVHYDKDDDCDIYKVSIV